MSLYLAKGNIVEQKVDAIVVPSQPSLKLEGVVGGEVKKACGKELFLELKQFKNINISECVIANSYSDNFGKVILVANPKWEEGKANEEENLRQSYISCMETAQDFGLNSIAFPILSIGAYNFPKRKAISIALQTISDFVEYEDLDVVLVIFDKDLYKNYKDLFEPYKMLGGKFKEKDKESIIRMMDERNRFSWYKKDLEKMISEGTQSKTFVERLNYYISIKGLTKQDCYLGVLSKSMFNNYLSGKSIPKKYTIVALGINMGLDVYEINELLVPFGDILDDRIPMDQLIMHDIYSGKPIEDINDDLNICGFVPLKTD